ncbi:hypothetical protein EBZ80_27485 [bacterium]|nr:hypothetical protein [bacterium]
MKYTIHSENGKRILLGPDGSLAAILMPNVNARQAEAICAACEEHYEPEWRRSKFLAALRGVDPIKPTKSTTEPAPVFTQVR